MVKTSLARKIKDTIAEKLGHEPTPTEIHNELSGAGLLVLADSIISKSKSNVVTFTDEEVEEDIVIPDINSEMKCPNCLSFDDWEYVDSDWEQGHKWVSYRCHSAIDLPVGFERCGQNIKLFLDDSNKPIFPTTKK